MSDPRSNKNPVDTISDGGADRFPTLRTINALNYVKK